MRKNVWAWEPYRPVSVRDSRGPERVVHEGPDNPEFTPRPVGFTANIPADPKTDESVESVDPWSNWDGDQA